MRSLSDVKDALDGEVTTLKDRANMLNYLGTGAGVATIPALAYNVATGDGGVFAGIGFTLTAGSAVLAAYQGREAEKLEEKIDNASSPAAYRGIADDYNV